MIYTAIYHRRRYCSTFCGCTTLGHGTGCFTLKRFIRHAASSIVVHLHSPIKKFTSPPHSPRHHPRQPPHSTHTTIALLPHRTLIFIETFGNHPPLDIPITMCYTIVTGKGEILWLVKRIRRGDELSYSVHSGSHERMHSTIANDECWKRIKRFSISKSCILPSMIIEIGKIHGF